MLFSDFYDINKDALKTEMVWNNYGLNDVLLTASDELKEKALSLLKQNYSKFNLFEIDGIVDDILNEMKSDVFTNFPLLMQSLSIAASMTYQSVSRTDHEIETRTVKETGKNTNNSTEMNNSKRDTINNDIVVENNSVIGEITNTGNVLTHEISERNETNTLDGNNTASTPMTGSKSVAVSHSMPEQAINGITHNFNKDTQGTPDLDVSTIQSANESYSTINQFQNTQIIDQMQTVDNTIVNNNTRTDDTKQLTDNATELHNTNDSTGMDILEGTNTINGINEIDHTTTDTTTRDLANKQYPFEVSKFLESIDSVKSFTKWIDAFSWICGVL